MMRKPTEVARICGGVHRVLGPVPGPGADLDPQQQRHVVVAAEHVPGLADLVEELVRRDPEEVGVHQLDRVVPAVEREAAAEPGERRLRDRRAEHAILELLLETLGGAPRPAVEPVHVLAHHHDGRVHVHPVLHRLGDDVDELARLELVGVKSSSSRTVRPSRPDRSPRMPTSRKRLVGPQVRPDALLAGLAVRVRLDQ